MNEIIIASSNPGKIEEFKLLFNKLELGIKIISLKDLNFMEDVPETGASFRENSFQKAEFIYNKFLIPVVSDDSGLEIKHLNNQPGIYSARYAGLEKDDFKNRQLVLKNLQNISDRTARFVCCLCFYDGKEKLFFEGFLEGSISKEERGENGFGYDAIFTPIRFENTMAEISVDKKNKISHRAQAMEQLSDWLRKNFCLSTTKL
jgi:XTP/dITP diphosphohydrolase